MANVPADQLAAADQELIAARQFLDSLVMALQEDKEMLVDTQKAVAHINLVLRLQYPSEQDRVRLAGIAVLMLVERLNA